MPTYVDTHCHLDMHPDDPAAVVDRARAAGVTTMVTVGTDMARSTHAVELAARFDGVYATVGVHPNDAVEATPHVLAALERLAHHPDVVGIGETGLDHYRMGAPPEVQAAAFRRHIALAKSLDRTLVIHCRQAWPELLRILEEEGAPDRVVMHCFSGDLDVARCCADAGWYMSFAGNVTFRNAEDLRAVAAKIPEELLLVETDSPFLTPHPHRGQRNEPAYVPLVVEVLAEVRGTDPAALAEVTTSNARRAFGLR